MGVDAVVIAVERGRCCVLAEGATVECRLRGRLARSQQTTTSLVVVGDKVTVTLLPDGSGAIEEILPRRSAVSRRAAGPIPREQVLAANLDLAAVVVSLREPPFKPGTVNQLLVGARLGGVEPLVVLNKTDLGTAGEVTAALTPLREAGFQCMAASAKTGHGLDELRARLYNRWTLFFGQSGVGKSSLLNALCPEAGARIQAVRVIGKGRHTTSGSRLYAVPEGGFIVDTPGVRTFSFWAAPREGDLAELFPEIADLAAGCRFRDCAHVHEPGCAVKEALERGEIDERRYRQFVRLARRRRGAGRA